MLTFEAPWTTRNTWGAPQNFFRHPHGLISDSVISASTDSDLGLYLTCRLDSHLVSVCLSVEVGTRACARVAGLAMHTVGHVVELVS